MPIKLPSFSTINDVCQCLLNDIESANAFSLGMFDGTRTSCGRSTQNLDQDELRACILETVDLLKHQLLERAAAVGQSRNSLLPIRRLPPEVLSLAIGYAMAEIDSHNHQRRLIQLSTVSGWWRTVILGNSSLWGVIHSKDPEWIVSLALDRSKDSPLTVLWEAASDTRNLTGRESYRCSIVPNDFFKLVSPHTGRWRSITLPRFGSGYTMTKWLEQHHIQLSQHLRQLDLCWHGSPSTANPVTGFSGLPERLSELKLHKLHVYSADITHILAVSSRLVSLDLESLVALDEQTDHPEETPYPTIDLPNLTNLTLKWLPSSILDPITQNLHPTTEAEVSIAHDMANQRNPDKASDPFASFVARLITSQRWVVIRPSANNITLGPLPAKVELRGPLSLILPWLRLRCLPQTTQRYWVELIIKSDNLSPNPEPVVIENFKHFPNVGSVTLLGQRESWRWIWLLSSPIAVETSGDGSEMPVKSWVWPNLKYLSINGDHISDFTILSVLLARHGSRSSNEPLRLKVLWVRPRKKVWRPEVVDRIRELLGPGCFRWAP